MPNARRQLYDWFTVRPKALNILRLSNKISTVSVYILYIFLVLFLLVNKDLRLTKVLAVPAAVFFSGTVLRAVLNFPRPYENGGTPPLFAKETAGKSFPSRHVFCAAVISVAWFYIWPVSGFALFPLVLLVAALRVVGGVHWPRDVAAGLAFGWLMGSFGFFIV